MNMSLLVWLPACLPKDGGPGETGAGACGDTTGVISGSLVTDTGAPFPAETLVTVEPAGTEPFVLAPVVGGHFETELEAGSYSFLATSEAGFCDSIPIRDFQLLACSVESLELVMSQCWGR